MDPDGRVRIVGSGKGAYFYRPEKAPELCAPGKPLTFRGIQVYKAPREASFDLERWTGTGGQSYMLDVVDGRITTTLQGGHAY